MADNSSAELRAGVLARSCATNRPTRLPFARSCVVRAALHAAVFGQRWRACCVRRLQSGRSAPSGTAARGSRGDDASDRAETRVR